MVTRVAARELKPQPVIIANAPNETKNTGVSGSKSKTVGLALLGLSPENIVQLILQIIQTKLIHSLPTRTTHR